jgi:hypothetical protein
MKIRNFYLAIILVSMAMLLMSATMPSTVTFSGGSSTYFRGYETDIVGVTTRVSGEPKYRYFYLADISGAIAASTGPFKTSDYLTTYYPLEYRGEDSITIVIATIDTMLVGIERGWAYRIPLTPITPIILRGSYSNTGNMGNPRLATRYLTNTCVEVRDTAHIYSDTLFTFGINRSEYQHLDPIIRITTKGASGTTGLAAMRIYAIYKFGKDPIINITNTTTNNITVDTTGM